MIGRAGQRVLGLHAHLGEAWISDGFDDPLPDEFWLKETPTFPVE
jgi:hypothetical protein